MTTTAIEWTDATWNPVTGCTKVSPGCDHCYAERITERFHGPGSFAEVKLHPDRLGAPLRWRKPRRVFVNSMSDLFHESVSDVYLASVFSVMRRSSRHTFQILTKRHARMRSLMNSADFQEMVWELGGVGGRYGAKYPHFRTWPTPNVWLGVSVETQQWADIRIPALLDTPAAVRFISAEPLLGPVTFRWASWQPLSRDHDTNHLDGLRRLDWVIAGGESGPGARPMQPEWPRAIRDQCVAAGVPFLFKQWGEYGQMGWKVDPTHSGPMMRMGKKNAGRHLDGRLWDQYPEVTA